MVSVRCDGPVLYITINTPTMVSHESLTIGDLIDDAMAGSGDQIRCLVLELHRVDSIGSSAIGTLVSIQATALRRGMGVFLTGVSDRITHLFETIRLQSVFTIYNTQTELAAAIRELNL